MMSLCENHVFFVFLSFLTAIFPVYGNGTNMIGRQSQNEGVTAVPAPGKVQIDGKLSDWDWSGRIEVFADSSLRGRYSVEMAAMWDNKYLYLAAKWNDPTPMFSMVDPQINPDKGWVADAWQIRMKTDKVLHLTCWDYAPRQEPCISVSYAKDGGHPQLLPGNRKGVFKNGIEMVYAKGSNGKSFVQEMRIPWKFLFKNMPELKPGLNFRMGNEFLWGDVTGNTWPSLRYADNMQPGVTSREFYWSNWKSWGNVTLAAKGKVKMRTYVAQDSRPVGNIPVRLRIPANAARFTIVIDDANGKRIRNLAGDFNPQDFRVAKKGDTQTVKVMWDGCNDAGMLVSPGKYRVRGLSHDGIGAEYEMCYDNPGTPPWATTDGSGAWGADHVSPCCVTRAGDWVSVSWKLAEGGSGIIGINPKGQKKWGEKRGAIILAGNKKYVFGILESRNAPHKLCRYDAKTGAYRPFKKDGKELPFELPVARLTKDKSQQFRIKAMAANDNTLVLAADNGKLLVIDPNTADFKSELPMKDITALAMNQQGECVAIMQNELFAIDLANGKTKELPASGLVKPTTLAYDDSGNVAVFDSGADMQVKVYSKEGKVLYTCGKKGGRPLRGKFEKNGLLNVISIALDAKGNVWAVEKGDNPRRVSVWGKNGKLVRQYIGNTPYSGTGSYLNKNELDYAYIGALRFRIDRKNRTSELCDILWVPDRSKNEAFSLWSHPHHYSNPGFVTSSASGKKKTYIYHNGQYSRYQAIHMKRSGIWQPVAALCLLDEFKKQCPNVKLPHGDKNMVVFWNDLNADGAVQSNECTPCKQKISIDCGWGHTAGKDLSIFTKGLTRFKPVRFTKDGAPVYGEKGIVKYPNKQRGSFTPVEDEKLILCLGTNRYPRARILGMDIDTGKMRWEYPNPYPGVHGSHKAPMPSPGLIIGPLKICGVADTGKKAGKVFMMRGNLGSDFYMTTDGLFVGSMFKDSRLPRADLPKNEATLLGQPMEAYSQGSEAFNGWFGKQSDGIIRMTCGIAPQSAMICRITGLDSIKKTGSTDLNVSPAEIKVAAQLLDKRKEKKAKERHYMVKRVVASPLKDGRLWNKAKTIKIARKGTGESAEFKIAYDQDNLYWRSIVKEKTPWKNVGKDFTRLFKTGDCVDLQIAVLNNKKHKDPVKGDMRIIIAPDTRGKAQAVLMQPVAYGPVNGRKVTYQTGWSKTLNNVAKLDGVKIKQSKKGESYTVEAAIPLVMLGLKNPKGKTILADVGFISGDAAGRMNVARTYWSNEATNLVSDEPLEAWLNPDKWGSFKFE